MPMSIFAKKGGGGGLASTPLPGKPPPSRVSTPMWHNVSDIYFYFVFLGTVAAKVNLSPLGLRWTLILENENKINTFCLIYSLNLGESIPGFYVFVFVSTSSYLFSMKLRLLNIIEIASIFTILQLQYTSLLESISP